MEREAADGDALVAGTTTAFAFATGAVPVAGTAIAAVPAVTAFILVASTFILRG